MRSVPLLAGVGLLLAGCGSHSPSPRPSIEWTVVPAADPGGPETVATIEGRVVGARPGQRIVLFARSGPWWVQPLAARPFTEIQPDGRFKNTTHLGTEYAALLVERGYTPPPTADGLPAAGGAVLAVAAMKGKPAPPSPAIPKTLHFSGYEWEARSVPSARGGTTHVYEPGNVWLDSSGALHLRIARNGDVWACAEVGLKRSLGYGTYLFAVRDSSHLEAAAVLNLFTRDEWAPAENHRELGVEISRWGVPLSKSAQYVVQPYYVPANVARFEAPSGVLTHSFLWEPGRAAFRTVRGLETGGTPAPPVAEHVFSSGIPLPGNESVRMSLYVFDSPGHPPGRDAEAVIERFEFFP